MKNTDRKFGFRLHFYYHQQGWGSRVLWLPRASFWSGRFFNTRGRGLEGGHCPGTMSRCCGALSVSLKRKVQLQNPLLMEYSRIQPDQCTSSRVDPNSLLVLSMEQGNIIPSKSPYDIFPYSRLRPRKTREL